MSTEGRVVYWRRTGFGFDVFSDRIGGDYMRRWVLRTPFGTLRVHHILRGDSDRHFHDHPMDFASLILRHGYVEHRPGHPPRRYRAGDVVLRRAEELHRLELSRPAWTLVLAGRIRREWGFQTEDGWIANGQYDHWRAAKASARQ